MLKINKKFAKKYEEYRRKEELQKFKDRYGDVKLSQAKSLAFKSDSDDAADKSDASSESESSDSECRGWAPGTEAGFLRVYAALQSGDSRLYDPDVNWFQEADADHDDEDEEEESDDVDGDPADRKQNEKHKPMYYNEFHRKFLLEGAYKSTGEETASEQPRDDAEMRKNLEEAERIRDSLARAHSKDSEKNANGSGKPDADDGDSDDNDDDFLVKRQQQQSDGDKADPMVRLHRFVAEPGDTGDGLEPDCRADLEKLKRHWTNEGGLTEAERYLRDYITKEFWRQPRQRSQPAASADSDSGSDQLSEDEAFLARQSEFESRWNGRTDERDPEFESEFRRTFASGDQQPDDDEDDDDDELFVVKKAAPTAAAEPELDEEAAAELLQLEDRRRERRPLERPIEDAEVAEVAEPGELAEGDDEAIRSYPRRIGDSLRQATSDAAKSRRRAELRERRRADRLARRREFDAAVRMKSIELERRLERLRRNAGLAEAEDRRVADTLGGDFLEEDFDPNEHDRRMARLFGEDFYGDGEGEAAKKPEFSEDEEVGGEADGETAEELRRRLQDEADRLGAEDLIRAGPGEADLPCRFNYRQVEPNDFGLSAWEILLADDRELNAWCSVRKASQYREREADWRDRRRFRSARAQEHKARLMPGMLKRLEAAAAFPDAKAWAAAAKAGRDLAANESGPAAAGADQKKRRRKKKKPKQQQQQQQQQQQGDSQEAEAADPEAPRSRKRRRPPIDPPAETALNSQEPDVKKQKTGGKQKKKKKQKLQISEQRLAELGIDPKKFRRMQKQQQQQKSSA